MRTLSESSDPGRQPTLALCLLSGTYSAVEDFPRQGFPDAVRSHGIAAEIVMAEVRGSYFADGSVVNRIRDEVVGPARARGCRRVWLAGISLGGLAALSFAARHEEDLEGVALIAPYPATAEVLREVESAGDLAQWQPAIGPGGDFEREAWRWLGRSRNGRVAVHCYLAAGDRFARGQQRMAATLDAANVRQLPGEHDWSAWRTLWNEFLSTNKGVLA